MPVKIPGEYGDALDIQEYKGRWSIVKGRVGKDDKFYPTWVFPQNKQREPMEKAIPFQISFETLGDLKNTLIRLLESIDASPDKAPVKDDIPF